MDGGFKRVEQLDAQWTGARETSARGAPRINPDGWREAAAALKQAGSRVICLDPKPVHGHGLLWTHIPDGAEHQTGDRPLTGRVRRLRHAVFFVGLGSGLSWLAPAAGCEVAISSGFTHPTDKFATPFRVVNWHACNGCWNDPKLRFDHQDLLWCPRHAGTQHRFACTRLITAQQVMQTIRRIPGFGRHAERTSV